MTKIIPLIVVVLAAAALWFAITSRSSTPSMERTAGVLSSSSLSSQQPGASGGVTGDEAMDDAALVDDEAGEALQEGFDDRPATEVYSDADSALKAVKAAAASYDDLVLDQFTQPSANCQWCDQFYTSIKELVNSPDTKADERSYYAEILAVSGRSQNVQTLIEAVKTAKSPEDAEVYAEALELSVGKEDVVKLLGSTLNDSNTMLQESAVAALTNQGSRTAAELLYDQATKTGKEDGYYSLGIGLGELVPEEDAIPYLQEKAAKRDAYSHLAVKALLNSGVTGLRMVNDMVEAGDNPTFDQTLLEAAKDHVAFDDDTVNYIKQQASQAKSPALKPFFENLLKEYEQSDADLIADEGGDEEPLFTPKDPIE